MNAPRDPDRMIHAFLMEGEEQLQDPIYDAVRAEIDQKRQRAFIGPWGAPVMNKITFGLGAAAVVLIGAVVGAQLLGSPGNTGSGGVTAPPEATATPEPSATPEPTATLEPSSDTLALGSFTAHLGEFGEAFDIAANRAGDDATGTMEVSFPSGADGAYSVDVQCTRTTADGNLMIGGEVTASTYALVSEGAYVVIVLVPGSPARAMLAIDVIASDEVPAPAESCTGFLDTLSSDSEFLDGVNTHAVPIEGDLVLGQ